VTAGNYTGAKAIVPSDANDLAAYGAANANLCDAIYVGGAGVVAVVFQDGTVVNFTCVAGEVLPVRARRVNATNTTATLMVALYYA